MAPHPANQRPDGFWTRSVRHRSTSPLPPNPMAPSQRTLSLQVASQNTPPAPSGYVKQWVSVYNLNWADLRKWLVETRFKNAPELDRVLVQHMDCLQDYFYFHVPEVLTAADADAISSSLRKKDASTTDKRIHRGRTPDPNPED